MVNSVWLVDFAMAHPQRSALRPRNNKEYGTPRGKTPRLNQTSQCLTIFGGRLWDTAMVEARSEL
ncbi:hypothetical protein KXV32_000657 [Aspergillus fumigatus]|nr:hypothetical protein KXV32_000657 [Aspergillus fumigatus]